MRGGRSFRAADIADGESACLVTLGTSEMAFDLGKGYKPPLEGFMLKNAARVTDLHVCPLSSPVPHVGALFLPPQ